MRKTVSLTITIAFLLLIVSFIVLYIVPEGRVAYWSDWHLLGLSKSQWGNVHITGGIVFVIGSIFHLILNFKILMAYLKPKNNMFSKVIVPLVIAVGINLFVFFGTLAKISPMKEVVQLNADIKSYHVKKRGIHHMVMRNLVLLNNFVAFWA